VNRLRRRGTVPASFTYNEPLQQIDIQIGSCITELQQCRQRTVILQEDALVLVMERRKAHPTYSTTTTHLLRPICQASTHLNSPRERYPIALDVRRLASNHIAPFHVSWPTGQLALHTSHKLFFLKSMHTSRRHHIRSCLSSLGLAFSRLSAG
jgi:hypothetical protein